MTENLEKIYAEFYRGFVELNDKKEAKSKYGYGATLKTFQDLEKLKSYGGVLAENTIFIDVDDMEQSEIVFKIVKDFNLNCRVTKTSRGRHFTFLNNELKPFVSNKNHIKLAIGIDIDVKSGFKNSYEVLKSGNALREVEREIDLEKPIDRLPAYLLPLSINNEINLLNLSEGDGRNQTLFNYILLLQRNAFRKEEIREILTIINSYVLKDKLSEKELSTIMRDEAFKKPAFFIKNEFLFDVFSQYIVRENNIKRINGALHVYADGVYKQGNREIEYQMIQHISRLNRSKRGEVMAYLDLLCKDDMEPSKAGLIAFTNGVYNIHDDTLTSFDPRYILLNKIPWDYNPKAYSKTVDIALDNLACGNKSTRILIEEMIGYTMFARNELGICFFLIGEGNNGKSTLIRMITNMLGKQNVSTLDISKLDDRFSTIMLYNKLANLGDDISSNYIKDTSTFKKIVTGDSITAEEKGQPMISFRPHVKLIFSANVVPRLGNGKDTYALMRRLIFIPLEAKFTKEKVDSKDYEKNAFKIDELEEQEAMEYLINIGIKALKRVLKNQEFTLNDLTKNELKRFEKENNPVLEFLEELDEKEDIDDTSTEELYTQYKVYCTENGLGSLGKPWFVKEVLRKYRNIEVESRRINGKKVKFFVERKNLSKSDIIEKPENQDAKQ